MRYYLLNKNRSNLLRKSLFKPSKYLANLLLNRSIKRNEEAYFIILKHNDEFYNELDSPLCELDNQCCSCSCGRCNLKRFNDEFYSQGNKKLCELDNQYCQCSCEGCRK